MGGKRMGEIFIYLKCITKIVDITNHIGRIYNL